MRILIIDDHADTKCRGIIEECKKRRIGVEIKRAINPALYRIFYEEGKIDGIVLDMGLPLYEKALIKKANEGERILRELARKKGKIPVLIFSEIKVNKCNYAHVFDQITTWDVVQEEEKFYKFLEKLEEKE